MQLQHLSVENYRCFEKLERLPFEEITALIGPNDSGKSSLLRLLSHCLPGKALPEGDFKNSSEPISVDLVFLIRRASDASVVQDVVGPDGTLAVRMVFQPEERPTALVHRAVFDDERLNRVETLTAAESTQVASELGLPKIARHDARCDAIRTSIREAPPLQHPGWGTADPKILQALPEFLLFGAAETLSLQSGPLLQTLRQVYKQVLDEQPVEVATLLSRARQRLDDEVTRINPTLATFLPEGTALLVDPKLDLTSSLQIGEIRVTTPDVGAQSFADCGDGTKRRIMLGLFHWANDILSKIAAEEGRSLLWGFDEPDTHLHYQSQYELLAQLKQMATGPMQIVLCTHSIPIIDRLPTSCVRHMVPNRSNRTTTVEYIDATVDGTNITNFLQSVGQGLGFVNSHLFYERCFLLVEGQTEEKALPILYRRLHNCDLVDDGIRLFAAENCDVALRLAVVLLKLGRRVTILLDRDAEPKGSKALPGLLALDPEMEARIVYVGEVEFEDAFDDEHIATCLSEHYPRGSSERWTSTEIGAQRSNNEGRPTKFSRQLLNVYASQEIGHPIGKPAFGRQLAESVPVDAIPEALRTAFSVARSTANPATPVPS